MMRIAAMMRLAAVPLGRPVTRLMCMTMRLMAIGTVPASDFTSHAFLPWIDW
jgi:hypothetical protein